MFVWHENWIHDDVLWRKMMRVANEAHKIVETKPIKLHPLHTTIISKSVLMIY